MCIRALISQTDHEVAETGLFIKRTGSVLDWKVRQGAQLSDRAEPVDESRHDCHDVGKLHDDDGHGGGQPDHELSALAAPFLRAREHGALNREQSEGEHDRDQATDQVDKVPIGPSANAILSRRIVALGQAIASKLLIKRFGFDNIVETRPTCVATRIVPNFAVFENLSRLEVPLARHDVSKPRKVQA